MRQCVQLVTPYRNCPYAHQAGNRPGYGAYGLDTGALQVYRPRKGCKRKGEARALLLSRVGVAPQKLDLLEREANCTALREHLWTCYPVLITS